MKGSAHISPCEVYRYNLVRVWDESLPRLCFVLLNPSTADAQLDDATLRRGISFAKAWGYGSVEFVNLYAFRATDPDVLRCAAETMDIIGPENDAWITEAAKRAKTVVLAWGANKVLPVRPGVVIALLKSCGHKLWCLGKTQMGYPKHPLRLAKTTPLESWEGNGKMTLPDKANVLNAITKALEDPGNDTVARRVVMRRAVWDLAKEIAVALKKDRITMEGNEVLAIAQECGITFTHQMIVRMNQGVLAQGTAAAGVTLAQEPGDVELSLPARADLYNAAFPNYPKIIFDKGWVLGVWNIGNNYKGSGFYGSYPPSYLKRVTPMFPDKKRVLHLFSGSLPAGDYVRFDRRDDLPNGVDVVGEAEELTKHFEPDSFDIIYADPPYSEADAQNYGTCLCNRNKVVKECATVLAPGGFLIWMDQVLPMYRKVEWKRCIEIAISRSTNHRVRAVFGFQRKEKVAEVVSASPPVTPEEQEEGYVEVFKVLTLDQQREEAMEF